MTTKVLLAKQHSLKSEIIKALRLSYPIVVAQLGIIAMGIADTMMVGQIGATELAAASLGSGLHFLVVCIGIGLTSVISPMIAQANATKDYGLISRILLAGLYASTILSILISFVHIILTYFIFNLGQEVEVATLAQSYLYVITFGVFPLIIFLAARNFTDGLSYTKIAMYITFGGLILNIFLNWLFIFGNWGFPRWGLFGAGVATAITRVMMMVAILWYIFTQENFKKYLSNFSFSNIDKQLVNKINSLGFPAGLQYFFEIGCFSIAALMSGWLGKYPLASHQVVINLASATYMVTTGIGAAGSILVGEGIGQKNKKYIFRSALISLGLASIFMVLMSILFLVFQSFWVGLYSTDKKVLEIAMGLLLIACLFQLSDGIQCVGLSILKGIEDVKIPTIITLVAYWIIGLPSAYLFAFTFQLGVYGIWYGLCLGLTASATLLNIRFFYLLKYKI
ncbi:MAG: MATE family efflux transporter [Bacteroidetes bacterium]|nr:MAG: MATE family efflux transporter [Bacteroidota bacterium]TAG88802.1 MAG: MATE family efflux transporter [Bacteroidota bacterium]